MWPVMYGWYGWGWGILMMVAFWGLLLVLVWILVRSAVGSRDERRARPDALEILDERFARGEIDEDEYRQKRRVLDSR